MGKVLKIIKSALPILGAVAGSLLLPGIGTAIGVSITAGIGGAIGGLGVSLLAKAVGLGPKKPSTTGSGVRSRVSLDPNAPQWLVIGQTACPAQLIYFGTSGATNQQLSMIFVHSCGPVAGFVSLALNNIPTPYAPVTGAYAGILTVETADGSQTANPFTNVEGGLWGAAQVGRGLAMSHFHWTYDATKLASGLPQNLQFVARGQPVYDPRRDSTRGGSGAMRANDETTWAYSVGGVDIGRNPALVELTYRLGWTKGGRIYAGMGEDPANIDYASYIASANVADEIAGSKPRYRIDTLLAIGPDVVHNDNLAAIHATCGAKTSDTGGLIGLWVAHDDTATAVMTLTDDDWFGDVSWDPLPEGEQRNTARGNYINVADFYLAAPYPEVAPVDLRALDNGVERADSLDFGGVQDLDQARRVASIRLRESRQGVFTAPTSLTALGLRPMQVVALDRPRIGWTQRKFRVESMALAIDQVQLTLRAIQSSDYDDVANTATVVVGQVPTLGYIGVPGVASYIDFANVGGTTRPADNADVTGIVLAAKGIQDGATRTAPAGAWTAPVAYLSGDVVTYGGASYVATAPHTSVGSQPPGVSVYWQLLAARGAVGNTGAAGSPGADGAPGPTGPVGPTAPPTAAIGTGTSSLGDPVYLEAGASISVYSKVSVSADSSAGDARLQAQASVHGAGVWNVVPGADATVSYGASEPFVVIANGIFTNSSGTAQLFDFRTVGTGFGSRPLKPELSYLKLGS